MDPNRFISLLPKVEVIATSNDSLFMAQQRVSGCEACDPEAYRPFSAVLDEVTNRHNGLTDYILCEPAKCTRCGSPIVENTFVSMKVDSPLAWIDLDTAIEDTNVVLVEEAILLDAQEWIGCCERCSEQAEYSFDQILDSLTGCNPMNTEYVLCQPARCPRCRNEVTEKTLVSPA